jgi:hypothetical protein
LSQSAKRPIENKLGRDPDEPSPVLGFSQERYAPLYQFLAMFQVHCLFSLAKP